MKKLLLLSAGIATSFAMMAQTDITPANYHFNKATEIPFYNEFLDNVNIKAGSNDVFGEMGFAEFYQDGLWVLTSAGQNADQQDAFRAGWQLVDMGGEVGQVAFFGGKASNVIDKLNEVAPDMADNWKALHLDEEATAGWQLHLMMDPDNCPTSSQGYIHARIVYNVYSENCLAGNKVWQNIGISTNSNDLRGWADSEAFNFTEDACILRYEDDNEPELGPDGKAIWDPSTWVVYEFDFTLPDADDSGQIYIPARLRMNAMNANAWNNYGVFLQDISFTFYEGENLGEGVKFANPKLSTITLEPFGDVQEGPGPEVPTFYLIGSDVDGQNWALGTNPFTYADGVYTWTGKTLGSGFKINDGTWDNAEYNIGAENKEVLLVLGEPYPVVADGNSGDIAFEGAPLENPTVVFDYEKMTVTVTGNAGVESIIDENAPVEYFNLQGVKVNNPQGVVIRKQGNSISKVLVR